MSDRKPKPEPEPKPEPKRKPEPKPKPEPKRKPELVFAVIGVDLSEDPKPMSRRPPMIMVLGGKARQVRHGVLLVTHSELAELMEQAKVLRVEVRRAEVDDPMTGLVRHAHDLATVDELLRLEQLRERPRRAVVADLSAKRDRLAAAKEKSEE